MDEEPLSLRKVGGAMDSFCRKCGTKLKITLRLDYCPNQDCDYAEYYPRY